MSNITYSTNNENFPVAGQDNDTQVFRDNFDSIKTALQVANVEITDLQDNVSRTDQENNFNGNVITNAKFINTVVATSPQGTNPNDTTEIDFQNGGYQILTLSHSGPIKISLTNFPAAGTSVGKVTVELYGSDATSRTVNFTLSESGATVVKSSGFPGYSSGIPSLTLTSSTNAVIFEVWRHTESTFFMRYVGEFA